ncbi:MAG: glycoside hydrolase family 65 [Lachnospiraceae bacterium]|nr:glycoside hydrolase family 65 [Lachnospiraceae bacterium]
MDRRKVVQRNNPCKRAFDFLSPLTVGNGSIAYTVDVTGMQTLYEEQEEAGFPLLTMSDWGWHVAPNELGGTYDLDRDFVMTEYRHEIKGTVKYAVKELPGNEAVYQWIRKNPHRYNLVQIGFLYEGRFISEEEIQDISQELDLYTGVLNSSFSLQGEKVTVTTVCHQEKDMLGWKVESGLCAQGKLQIMLRFPYGNHLISGADWKNEDAHKTRIIELPEAKFAVEHLMDNVQNYVAVYTKDACSFEQLGVHCYTCMPGCETFEFTIGITKEQKKLKNSNFLDCVESSKEQWKHFWENGGLISFEGSTDKRAAELERRIILSLYVSRINSCISQPPQETGLTVNSWYGKAHLEMYLWHLAYLPLWGRSELLKKSLGWYKEILPQAQKNAARNGYKGAKWPKMVGPEGVDCPSKIATLLVWQQPHLLYMMEMIYKQEQDDAFLEEYWELVEQTAEYMVDFAEYNAEKNVYELVAPLIPAQERHKPEDTRNPLYETEYWRLGLEIAMKWAERLGKTYPVLWKEVAEHMSEPTVQDGVYLAHGLCVDTYTKYAEDHPSMVAAMGLLPGDRIDPQLMQNTLDKIYQVWNFKTMWGWDFAMMAMTETRLGNPDRALEILLYDTEKNQYMGNGHNCQVSRKDLPLYLPGNGSLLLAIPMMAMGFPGSTIEHPGFPQDGSWKVEAEGIAPFIY